MNFHWPSFLLGYGSGVLTVVLGKRLRPVLSELASTGYQLIDSFAANLAMKREDVEDMLAEARARVAPPRPAPKRQPAARPRPATTRRKSRQATSRSTGRRGKARAQSA